jgi:hypothetical protein
MLGSVRLVARAREAARVVEDNNMVTLNGVGVGVVVLLLSL